MYSRGSEQTALSCCNSSLLECPATMQEVGSLNPGRDMSVSGALIKDGDDFGKFLQTTIIF
jgi:hypothetical protein